MLYFLWQCKVAHDGDDDHEDDDDDDDGDDDGDDDLTVHCGCSFSKRWEDRWV